MSPLFKATPAAPTAPAPIPANLRSRETPYRELRRESDWTVTLLKTLTSAAFVFVGAALLLAAGIALFQGAADELVLTLLALDAFDWLCAWFWFRYVQAADKTLFQREIFRDHDGDGKPDGHDPLYVDTPEGRKLRADLAKKRRADDWRFVETAYRAGTSYRKLKAAGYDERERDRLIAVYEQDRIGIFRRLPNGEYALPYKLEDAKTIFDALVF